MDTNKELLDKLKEFLSEDEIKQGIEKGVIIADLQKSDVEKSVMPFTTKEAGLESGTGSIVSTTPAPASWEMVKTSMQKALDDVEKAYDAMQNYVEKGDGEKEKEGGELEIELKKAYDKMTNNADKVKDHLKMMMGKKNQEKSLDNHSDSLEKAFTDRMNLADEKNSKLEKSMGQISEVLTKLQSDIQKFGEQTPAPKSVNLKAFIEKGGVKDDDGKKIYHMKHHKNQIVNELEKARGNADDLMKGYIDDDILVVCGADGVLSEKVAQYLYDKSNIKIIK